MAMLPTILRHDVKQRDLPTWQAFVMLSPNVWIDKSSVSTLLARMKIGAIKSRSIEAKTLPPA